MQIRAFAPCDLPGMYRVCRLTGHVGTDATALYRDPELLGHVYCGPYPSADPTLSWVVTDDHGVAGYLVGAADTLGLARWQEAHWWPALRERYPLPAGTTSPGTTSPGASGPASETFDHELVRVLHEGQPVDAELVARYPAHLHIDLLPRAQGAGLGRALVGRLTDALRERGVPGLHLGVHPGNTGAVAFYTRIGLTPVPVADGSLVLGRPL